MPAKLLKILHADLRPKARHKSIKKLSPPFHTEKKTDFQVGEIVTSTLPLPHARKPSSSELSNNCAKISGIFSPLAWPI